MMVNSSVTKLTEANTRVGNKTLGTYVGDIVAGKLTADDVTIKCNLNVGGDTYYLRMGPNWTKNPEVSGLNVGSQGIVCSSGISCTNIGPKSGTMKAKGTWNWNSTADCTFFSGSDKKTLGQVIDGKLDSIKKTYTGTCTVGGKSGTCSITIS